MALSKAPVKSNAVLVIEGDCARPAAFSFHDLRSIHEDYQVPDAAKVDQRLKGSAVRLRALLDLVGPGWHSRWLTVESEDGKFSVSLPLEETRASALVVYGLKNKPLERSDGGPVRFVVPFHPDDCTRVKGATRLIVSEERGRDTRPADSEEHRKLHARPA